jgi:hypothetical protein
MARREDMLDAIRLIVLGEIPPGPIVEHEQLNAFCAEARRLWSELIAPLPENDPGRMPHGYYSLSFEIIGVQPAADFAELASRMTEARQIRHTGWGPFVALNRNDLAPKIVDNAIQAWLGVPDANRALRTAEHCDFWRASRDGLLYLQRGYDEDSLDDVAPGTILGVTLPVWRVGEAVLFVSRLAGLFGDNPQVFVRVHYTGLRDRLLSARGQNVQLRDNRRSADNEVETEIEASAQNMDDNLVEVIHELLSPLYERFDFLQLGRDFVARQLDELRRNRF